MKINKDAEESVGRLIYNSTKRYFEKEEHRRAFEEWYSNLYGKPYVWKTMDGIAAKKGQAI